MIPLTAEETREIDLILSLPPEEQPLIVSVGVKAFFNFA